MSVVLAMCRSVSAKCRQSGVEVSAGCWPTFVLADVGRYVGRVSAGISVEYRSIYRSTVGRHIERQYRPILGRRMP